MEYESQAKKILRGTGAGNGTGTGGVQRAAHPAGSGGGSKPQSISRPAVESGELQFTHPAAGDTIAVFDTSAGVFKAVLFPGEAPQAYDNFAGLVQSGYYNGLTVSRVEKDFLVEAGQGADGQRHHHLERQPLPH